MLLNATQLPTHNPLSLYESKHEIMMNLEINSFFESWGMQMSDSSYVAIIGPVIDRTKPKGKESVLYQNAKPSNLDSRQSYFLATGVKILCGQLNDLPYPPS